MATRIEEITNSIRSAAPSTGTIGTGLIVAPALLNNPTPDTTPTMLHQKIILYTKDNTDPANPKYIVESYNVTPGNFTVTRLLNSGGKRFLLQFGTTNYGMKFHMPSGPDANTIYITYCEKNTSYVDGWKDYSGTVTQSWIDAAISFANRLPVNSISPTSTQTATRSFSSAQFPRYKTFTLFAYYKGTGASSSINAQGRVEFQFAFLENPTVIDPGTGTIGTGSLSESTSTTISNMLSSITPTASR